MNANGLFAALTFLTRLRLNRGRESFYVARKKISDPNWAVWAPVVGLIVGGLLAGGHVVVLFVLPPLLAAAVTVMLWAFITGALHLDGVADCADAMLYEGPVERRLEIMKDANVGAFGVVAIVLVLTLKVAALSAVRQPALALIVAPTVSRWLMMWVAKQPPARAGSGATFGAQVTTLRLAVSAVAPLAAVAIVGIPAVLAVACAAVAVAWLTVAARRRLGGVTGDVLGCAVEVSEVTVLVGLVATSGLGEVA